MKLELLLAEDEPTQRLMLERMIERYGYSVDTAEDGERALTKVLGGKYQILLTDWDMPKMDGVTLCKRVREAKLSTYIYIIIISGKMSTDEVVAGLAAGADDYVRKPANSAELIARLSVGGRVAQLEESLRSANDRIQLLSITDPDLGIYNRRYLNDQLEKEVERARRFNQPLAIAMADMDRLKAVNDVYGHHVGGEVLKGFANTVKTCIGDAGWVALYGGEEFVIVLPDRSLVAGAEIAEEIRRKCASVPIMTSVADITVTASFGVAALPSRATIPSSVAAADLVRSADDACYRSKREGRNRVTLASLDTARAAAKAHEYAPR